ncbi:MAG: MEDS domain-containing protein [Pseudonocardia sp.]|nr:MEDS domain-containing protein [Pseudonocardia sp.]
MTGISTIDTIDRAGHTCLIPDSEDHLWEATASYVAGGLAAGERVIYFEDDTAGVLLGRLSDDRVPVAGAIEDGGLVIVPGERTRQVCAFPVVHIVELMRRQIEESDIGGWPGIRLAGESRKLLPIGGLRKLIEYETAVDLLLATHPNAGMLCRFDRRFFDDEAVAAMREIHATELVTPALYDDTLLRVTGSAPTALRFAGEIDLSNRPQVRRLLENALDSALRSPYAATDITIDLTSLRFIDVAGAVELVHAAETFPETHRLVLVGARPGILRVLDRCGAPFAAQLEVVPREEVR